MRTLTILVLTARALTAQGPLAPAQALPPDAPKPAPDIRNLNAQMQQLRAQIAEQSARARKEAQEARDRARTQTNEAREKARAEAQARTRAARTTPDNWWRNEEIVRQLGLTPAQVRQMEETFQQHRLKLIDLNAALEKEEVVLTPLVSAETLDEGKLTAQIDRVAQARAELEKQRGRMLIGIRKQLNAEQWRKLNGMGLVRTGR